MCDNLGIAAEVKRGSKRRTGDNNGVRPTRWETNSNGDSGFTERESGLWISNKFTVLCFSVVSRRTEKPKPRRRGGYDEVRREHRQGVADHILQASPETHVLVPEQQLLGEPGHVPTQGRGPHTLPRGQERLLELTARLRN